MKALIVSVSSFCVILVLWWMFCSFGLSHLDTASNEAAKGLRLAIESENWTEAKEIFADINTEFSEFRKFADLVLDADAINEIEGYRSMTGIYISNRNQADALAYLDQFCISVKIMQDNQHLSVQNLI